MTAIALAPGVTIPHRALTRHIAIYGATGTGKTTTAAAIVERAPCPVIVLDVKGDLESMGTLHRPWRAQMRIDELGADLVARALDLSDAQAGALQVALAVAEDSARPVATLGDLRALLSDCVAHAPELTAQYGLISPLSVAAVQRAILRLERAAPWAFGPATVDWRDTAGIAVYSASGIASVPGLYGAFVASVLDSLYRGLGEIGDTGAPGLMLMIDEAHLVFDGASPAIVRRIEQVTRLIRSKGVGLIYVTQSPADLPDAIAGQMSSRIQHGLRAATARQAKGVRAAAETMPGNVTAAEIAALGIGQAFISIPNARGVVQPAKRAMIARGAIELVPVAPENPPAQRKAQPVAYAEDEAAPMPRQRLPFWKRALCIAAGGYCAIALCEAVLLIF